MRGCAAPVLRLWSDYCTKMGESQVLEKMTVKMRRIVWSQIMYDPLLSLFEGWFHEL